MKKMVATPNMDSQVFTGAFAGCNVSDWLCIAMVVFNGMFGWLAENAFALLIGAIIFGIAFVFAKLFSEATSWRYWI
jgi:hypothetical protein